jgi:DNA-binding response OmpR family regulator
MVTIEPIWILDSDPGCVNLYKQTLGLQYTLCVFSTFEEFAQAYANSTNAQPRLLIAEPEDAKSALANFFRGFTTESERRFPETLIVSRNDEVGLMRFYLRLGVRDYILKPIRPNELVAKVEKALLQIDNRSVLILKNDLDGHQLTDLTFREHQIMTVFLNSPSRTIDRDSLIERVWVKTLVNRKTLDVHVFNLRRKLRPIGYDIVFDRQRLYLSKLPSKS